MPRIKARSTSKAKAKMESRQPKVRLEARAKPKTQANVSSKAKPRTPDLGANKLMQAKARSNDPTRQSDRSSVVNLSDLEDSNSSSALSPPTPVSRRDMQQDKLFHTSLSHEDDRFSDSTESSLLSPPCHSSSLRRHGYTPMVDLSAPSETEEFGSISPLVNRASRSTRTSKILRRDTMKKTLNESPSKSKFLGAATLKPDAVCKTSITIDESEFEPCNDTDTDDNDEYTHLQSISSNPKKRTTANNKTSKSKGRAVQFSLKHNGLDNDADDQTRHRVTTPRQLLKILETTQLSLAKTDDLQSVLKSQVNSQSVQAIRKQCTAILGILGSDSGGNSTIPSTIGLYGQDFVYRAGQNRVYLLRVSEAFQGNSLMATNKVFGLVRHKNGEPLMMKLPGCYNCADPHPRLLDNPFWLAEVRRYAEYNNHNFQKSQYETHAGRADGDYFACHVEPSLMLWFACYMVKKLLNLPAEKTVRYTINAIQDIREMIVGMKDPVEAEIVLTAKPCPGCRAFKRLIEKRSGIKFTIILCPNLGVLEYYRNAQGYKRYPTKSLQPEPEEDDNESVPLLITSESRARLEVVIRSSSSSINQKTSKARQSRTLINERRGLSQVSGTQRMIKQQKRLQPGSYEEDHTDYTPLPTRTRNQNKQSLQTPPHGGSLFPEDAHAVAREMRDKRSKKRRNQNDEAEYPSPISAKKPRQGNHHTR